MPHPRAFVWWLYGFLHGGISVCVYIALADWLVGPKSGGAKICF